MFLFRSRTYKARASRLMLAVLLAGGAGCSNGDSNNADFGDNDPSVVVAVGDSITFGKHDGGLDSCDHAYRNSAGFCYRLANLTGKTVGNEGECGETSYGGLDKIDGVLLRWRPGVVLIDYSPNDLPYGVDATIANLRGMIAAARANKTVPVLGTLVPAVGEHDGWEPFIQQVNARILALCDEERLSCADHHKAFVNDPGFQTSPYALLDADGLHPNSAGYNLMAETWRGPLMRQY